MATYWVDPDATDDTGDGSKSNPWKTINHTVSAGDIVQIKKSPLTTMGWTVSGTYGQKDLTASSDPSGDIAQYDIIKVDGEYYLVKGLSGTTIQTYKPFLSTTGGGYTVEKVGVFDIGSTYWQVYSSGADGNKISYKGGFDWSSEVQDGETFISGSGSYCLYASGKSYFHVERLHPVHATSYSIYVANCSNFDVDDMILGYYQCYVVNGANYRGIQFNNLEIQTSGQIRFEFSSELESSDIDFWVDGTYVPSIGYSAMNAFCAINNLRVNGCTNTHAALQCKGELLLSNMEIGQVLANTSNRLQISYAGSLITVVNSVLDPYLYGDYQGKLISLRHNQISGSSATSLCYYGGSYQNGYLESDNSIYRTASPSIKFTPKSSYVDIYQDFEIPVDAGSITISIYLRKDSSYNGSIRPTAEFVYYTGTTDTTWHKDEVEMTDVNDTWEQVSKAITIDEDQVIRLRVKGRGTAGNFWCDDLSVS